MPTLNMAVLKRIDEILNESLFTNLMFKVTTNNENDIIQIEYTANPSFKYLARKADVGKRFESIESPGIYFREAETVMFSDPGDLEKKISDWVARIEEEELTLDTGQSYIDQIRTQIQQTADSISDPNIPFQEKEAKEWTDRFDELVKKMDSMSEELKLTTKDLNDLKKELGKMKDLSTKMSRSTWLRSTGFKIAKWFDNKLDRVVDKSVETTIKTYLQLPMQ